MLQVDLSKDAVEDFADNNVVEYVSEKINVNGKSSTLAFNLMLSGGYQVTLDDKEIHVGSSLISARNIYQDAKRGASNSL